MRPFRIVTLCILLCAMLMLCGCTEVPDFLLVNPNAAEETAPEDEISEIDLKELTEELVTVVTAGDIYQLDSYPNLKHLDLSGSTCYDAIISFIDSHPQINVTYNVSLGSIEVDSQVGELKLHSGKFDYATLVENLKYLPNVQTITFPNTDLTADEISYLQEMWPEINILYTAELLGKEYDTETTELDLSDITPEQVDEAAEQLVHFANLSFVELMSNGSSSLSKQDVRKLEEAAPNAIFHYTFSLFGQNISTNDPKVSYVSYSIGDEGEAEIREALSIMTGCEEFILDSCGINFDILAAMNEDFPNVDVVFRAPFGVGGKYSYFLTNAETIRAVYNVTDDDCYNLRYYTKVKYMDLGHNDTLSDLSFVGHMPDLEILVASGCLVSDLSGFENCKKLEFLELAYCVKLKDITPLAGCTGLKHLNLAKTWVTDLSPLDGLPLEQFSCKLAHVPIAEQETFRKIHPDCITSFTGVQPYGMGWRYIDNGIHFTEIYKKVREVFELDKADAIIKAMEDAQK